MYQNRSLRPMLAMFDDRAGHLRPKVIGLYAILGIANLLSWLWAVVSFRDHPLLLATGLIAFGFGLRHAVDADHIAAIDNVTRKLMQEGKQPITVGLHFSLGHSTVVFAASLAIALTASSLQQRFPRLIEVGSVVGTSVSVLFLIAIAMINLIVMAGVYRLFHRLWRGGAYTEEELNVFLARRGLVGRLLRGLFRLFLGAGTCTRSAFFSGWVLTRPPRSACSGSRPRKPQRACRSGRSWYSRHCSPRACRSSTPATAC